MRMHELRRSRAVSMVGYDRAEHVLRVYYRTGGRYDYLGVPPCVFAGLLGSEHPWTEWGAQIKQNYPVRPLS
jgi:hypothetical protein